MKTLIILLLAAAAVFSQSISVDSVIVDSVWNSDSASRVSRDCRVSFIPQGQGNVHAFLHVSSDGGATWWATYDSAFVLGDDLLTRIPCGQKKTITVRVLGGDRENFVIKIRIRKTLPNTTPPAWATSAISAGWAVGTWARISGPGPSHGLPATNTCWDVADQNGTWPSNFDNGLFQAWNGAVLNHGHRDYGTMMLGPGGAHNEYGRGDVYLFDLGTRTWEEVAPPNTSGMPAPSSNPYGEYNDGVPIKNHCGRWGFYDSYRNEFAYPKGWASPTSGSDQYGRKFGHGFDLSGYDSSGYSSAQWRRYPSLDMINITGVESPTNHMWSLEMGGVGTIHGCVWDEGRNSVWMLAAHYSSGNNFFARYDSPRNKWVRYAGQQTCLTGTGAVDPIRDVLACPATYGIALCQLSSANRRRSGTGGSAFWYATETGTEKPSSHGMCGWEWSEALDGFIYFRSSADPAKVKLAKYVSGGLDPFPIGTNPADYTLNWTSLLSGSNTIVPPQKSYSYSRFRLAKWGDTEIGFWLCGATEAVYAFRVN
jgi:hypothetical protein